MLSLRVNAFPQVGQLTFFSPVCFLPWRAAWPEVVNVSAHLYSLACGQGYFFLGTDEAGVPEEGPLLLAGVLLLVGAVVVVVAVVVVELVIGVVGSVLMGAEVGEVVGGAEVGSFLAFTIGIWGWFG